MTATEETPPRAWRRRFLLVTLVWSIRNTSTGVEKTITTNRSPVFQQKHLHGRGEDAPRQVCRASSGETPPRAWRRQADLSGVNALNGNTSTGVEKTIVRLYRRFSIRKHLHGRGEDP